jgi:hypothetical protein
MTSDTIGDRWDRYVTVCEAVVETERTFDEREQDFANNMLNRLRDYEDRTYASTAQINWLNRLEQKCKDEGLL